MRAGELADPHRWLKPLVPNTCAEHPLPMSSYRVTFRYGAPRALYEVLDVEAPDLRAAMRVAADRVPDEVAATAELVELRVQTEPEAREYTQG